MQSQSSMKSDRAYDKLSEARLHCSEDNWVMKLREEINEFYDKLCPKDPQKDNKLKPEQIQLLSKFYGSKQFCTLDEARAQIEVITGKPGDQSCNKDEFLIYLEKCLIHCGEHAPDIVAEWHKKLRTTYVDRDRETERLKHTHEQTHKYRYASQVRDMFHFIGSKKKRKKKRSNRNKKKRGLFSRIFGSAPDSKKAEEKEKVRKDASASFPLSASMGPQSIGSERSSLRRHGSSFRNERSVLLGKPTTKFDHYSQKFTED